jgi:HSP90 family molecular chaperone
LDIVTNSLYTDKEVFVRELVSNASDALEKCRHEFLVRGQDPGSLTIDITTDEEKGTFSIADTGLGMSKDDLIANLGVIARSGSRAFVEEIDGSSSDDSIQKQNNRREFREEHHRQVRRGFLQRVHGERPRGGVFQ